MDVLRAGLDNSKFANHKDMICWVINATDDIHQRRLGVVNDDGSSTTVCSPTTSDVCIINIIISINKIFSN